MTAQTTTVGRRPTAAGDDGRYAVRPFESDDESSVLDLAGGPRPGGIDRAWFEWCCRENPAVDHVPMAVVEDDGEVVGALPFRAVRVRAGADQALAVRPDDVATAFGRDPAAVARRALAGAIEYYGAAAVANRPPRDVDVVTTDGVDREAATAIEDPPAFVVVPSGWHGGAEADPSDGDWPAANDDGNGDGNGDGGWPLIGGTSGDRGGSGADEEPEPRVQATAGRAVGPVSEEVRYDRLQGHGAFLARRIPGPPGRAVGAAVSAVGGRIRGLRDGRADFETAPFAVARHRGVPGATLGACYEASVPASAHVVLDEGFFDWWYAEPGGAPTRTYVVHRGDRVAAGIVARRREVGGVDAVDLSHVVPLTGDPARPAAVAAGLERLLAEHRDADVVRMPNAVVPSSVRQAYGFGRADSLPTSLFVRPPSRTLDVRPVVEGERTVGPRPIGEAASTLWSVV